MTPDRYIRAVRTLIARRYAEWDANPPTSAHIGLPQPKHRLKKFRTVHGVEVPVQDEDWPTRTLAEKAIHALFRSPVYPVYDDPRQWESSEQARTVLTEVMGPRLIPPENGHWEELQSDAAQSAFAFAGLGAALLERMEDGFVVDTAWMAELPVRAGYEPYGVTAFFDVDRRLTRLWWGHEQRDVLPGDPAWEHVKFAWRCSVFVGLTLASHLWGLHLRIGNEVVTATREHLGADHPLRRLLKPYAFRTIAINHRASAVLVVNRGLPHRAFGLDIDGLAKGLLGMPEAAVLRPLPQRLTSRGVADLPDFPLAEDGLELYGLIEGLVRDWMRLYGEHDRAEVEAWWQAIVDVRPDVPLSEDALVDVVAAFIFSVVAEHKHVGALREYLFDPAFVAPRIHPGALRGDVQGSFLTMLLVSGTGLEQPRLLSDFSHLVPDRHADAGIALLDRFQAALRALSAEITRRNETRPQPYWSMDPSRLECSVSI